MVSEAMPDDRLLVQLKKAMLLMFALSCFAIFLAPLSLPFGTVGDLSGSVGSIDNDEIMSEMNGFAHAVYFVGDWNCHQKAERSLFINGNEMPICARDTGVLIGLSLGMLVVLLIPIQIKWPFLILGLIPLLIDGGAQIIFDYESINLIRIITGALGGVSASLLLVKMAERIYNS